MTRGRFLAVTLGLGAAMAVASFFGGTVGSMIAGRSPVGFLAVDSPHVELPPGHLFGPIFVTNTLLATWLSCAVILVVFLHAARRAQPVPAGIQNPIEYACEFATGFLEDMVGSEQERRFFPIVMTVFLFVLVNAWFGLLPGFDSLTLNGIPVFRSANTDINVPLMLAIVCVASIEFWGFRARGLSYLKTFFNFHQLFSGIRKLVRGEVRDGSVGLFFGILYVFVGLLEFLAHATRLMSFSFRLFGNMTSGVVLTGVALFFVPLVLPSVFYALEALFGVVQALVFAGLTAVFGSVAVSVPEH